MRGGGDGRVYGTRRKGDDAGWLHVSFFPDLPRRLPSMYADRQTSGTQARLLHDSQTSALQHHARRSRAQPALHCGRRSPCSFAPAESRVPDRPENDHPNADARGRSPAASRSCPGLEGRSTRSLSYRNGADIAAGMSRSGADAGGFVERRRWRSLCFVEACCGLLRMSGRASWRCLSSSVTRSTAALKRDQDAGIRNMQKRQWRLRESASQIAVGLVRDCGPSPSKIQDGILLS